MAPSGTESSGELLGTQAHIWNHMFNYINSLSLKCAIQLGIPDVTHNHGRPITLSELAKALPINQKKDHYLYRLMRILIHSGFFAKQKISENEEEQEGYVLTPASKLLLQNQHLSVAPVAHCVLDSNFIEPWHHLTPWFQNDDPSPFYTAHGSSIWEYIDHEPKFNHLFDAAMASDSRIIAEVLVRDFKQVFEGLRSLVDVGGGNGTLATAIAHAFPHLNCINFDLPQVIAELKGNKNLSYVGGDMFESIPPADAVLLKWIMHDWGDEDCVKILKNCKQAIPSKDRGGKVIIIDMILQNQEGNDKSMETQLFFDMCMMVDAMGTERTEKEWAKLFAHAGFSDYKIIFTLGLRSLVEVYP